MAKELNEPIPPEEIERRMNAAIKRALNTPPKPHEPLGKKKPRKSKATKDDE